MKYQSIISSEIRNSIYKPINHQQKSAIQSTIIPRPTPTIPTTITADYGCAMGPNYDYIVNGNYPILVLRRMDSGKELIKFSPLPLTESEFLKLAVITENEAKSKVSNLTINFSDLAIPVSKLYSYIVKRDQIENTRLTRLRTNFCNTTYPQGSIDSAVRVVWEIKMFSSSDDPNIYKNKSYWYNWLIYVDAITGEIVKVVKSKIGSVNKPVPGWDVSFNLPKIGEEYVQLTL